MEQNPFFLQFLLSAILIVNTHLLSAQTKDDNVIITNGLVSYSFENGKEGVFIKEKSETYYECTKRGTTLPVVEFYTE